MRCVHLHSWLVTLLGIVTLCPFAFAEPETSTSSVPNNDDIPVGFEPPKIHPIAILDGYFSFSIPESPSSLASQLVTTASAQSAFAVNAAVAGFQLEHAQLIGQLSFQAGTSVNALYNRTLFQSVSSQVQWLKYVQTAWAGYRFKNVELEFGLMPSQLGVEGFLSTDNWNYTRAYLSELRPYFVMGAKVTWFVAPSIKLSAMVHNGWQGLVDINKHKSGMLRFEWKPSHSFVLANAFQIGSESTEGQDLRLTNNLSVQWFPHTQVRLAFETMINRDQGIMDSPMFYGAALWARYLFNEKFSLTFRGEGFLDFHSCLTRSWFNILPNSNAHQNFAAATLTFQWAPHPSLFARIEAVQRFSNQQFLNEYNRQTLLMASLAFAYSK